MDSKFLGLRTVVYFVENLGAAKEWYASVLGKRPYFDEPFYVGFDVGGYELGLLPDSDEGSKGEGGTTAYWGVDDAESAFDYLLGLGATARNRVEDVGEGIKVGTVIDPFGNRFGVIENPHFKV